MAEHPTGGWRFSMNGMDIMARFGAYGMQANVNPQRLLGAGVDRYYDYGFDVTYQYLGTREHIYELNATYLREQRDMNASVALGLAEKQNSSLDTARIRAGCT